MALVHQKRLEPYHINRRLSVCSKLMMGELFANVPPSILQSIANCTLGGGPPLQWGKLRPVRRQPVPGSPVDNALG